MLDKAGLSSWLFFFFVCVFPLRPLCPLLRPAQHQAAHHGVQRSQEGRVLCQVCQRRGDCFRVSNFRAVWSRRWRNESRIVHHFTLCSRDTKQTHIWMWVQRVASLKFYYYWRIILFPHCLDFLLTVTRYLLSWKLCLCDSTIFTPCRQLG